MKYLIIFFPILLGCFASSAQAQGASPITIDASQKYQTIDGFELTVLGDQFGQNEYVKSHQDLANELVDDFGFNYIKFRFDLDNVEPVNDDANPLAFNKSAYDTTLAAQEYVDLFSMIKKFYDNGAKIHLSAWAPPIWMRIPTPEQTKRWSLDPSYSRPALYQEIAELWAAALVHLRDNYGVTAESIVLWNEPTDIWSPFRFTLNEAKETVKALSQRFSVEGLATKVFIGDDGFISTNIAVANNILNDPLVAPYVGGITYHTYDNYDRTNPDSFISPLQSLAGDSIILGSGLELRMTEWAPTHTAESISGQSMAWAKLIYNTHVFGRTNIFDVWGLMPIAVMGGGPGQFKDVKCGLSSYAAPNYTTFEWKKLAYAMKQYARFIEHGSQMIDVAQKVTSGTAPAVTAYLHPVSDNLTIVAINKATSSQTIDVTLNNGSNYSSYEIYRTSATEDAALIETKKVSGNIFSYILLSESITTFVSTPKAFQQKVD